MKYTAYLLGKEMDYRWTNFTGLIALGMTMLDSLLNQGGKVFMDNFYTSPTVFLELFSHKTNDCRSVTCNRKQMPKDINKKSKLKQGESIFLRARNLAMLWGDKRKVFVLSTMHDATFRISGKNDRQSVRNQESPSWNQKWFWITINIWALWIHQPF